ncbi:hypothetical protein M422DRAFT_773288 [Sphaerobolus stellatus SS14]|nr:hypothetical protein M422DRAFT_773288 [Sphaerobolus stellatus SS14]
MLDGIVNKPNHVPERQRMYQHSTTPLYIRGPRAKLYYGLFLVGFSVGIVGTGAGIVSLIKGKPTA